MSAGRKPPTERDDESTSRQPVPRARDESEAPEKPTLPDIGRLGTRRRVDPDLTKTIRDDIGEDHADPEDATTIDPEVPSGMREPARRFDPGGRGRTGNAEDPRRHARPATDPVIIDDADGRAPLATVIGKRNAGKLKPAPRVHDVALTNRRDAPLPPPEDTVTNRVRAPALPLGPGPRSEPFRAVSMKPPAGLEAEKPPPRVLPEVRLRAMSELNQTATPARGMGFLAPPRDPREARSRRLRDNVIWGSVAVMVAAVVMLAVWFLAR